MSSHWLKVRRLLFPYDPAMASWLAEAVELTWTWLENPRGNLALEAADQNKRLQLILATINKKI